MWLVLNMSRTLLTSDVRILFGDDGIGPFTLFEFVDPYGFKVTLFEIETRVGVFHEEVSFLDDFIVTVPGLALFPSTAGARINIRILETEIFTISTEELGDFQRQVRNVARSGAEWG